jgi:hypothetical protein
LTGFKICACVFAKTNNRSTAENIFFISYV